MTLILKEKLSCSKAALVVVVSLGQVEKTQKLEKMTTVILRINATVRFF